MKIGIIGIMNNPSSSINSHSAGWNNIIKDLIDNSEILNQDDNWLDYDTCLDQGLELFWY